MTTLKKNNNLAPKVCKIQYASLDNIYSIVIGSSPFSRVVNFKPGFGWEETYKTPGTVVFEQTASKESAGTLYTQKIEFFFPGMDISNLSELFNMDYTKFVVKLSWSNGDSYIIGSKDNPVIFSDQFSSTSGGSKFAFNRKSIDKAFMCEN